MPYKQMFHRNSEYNNRILDVNKGGEGFFDFISPAVNLIKANSDAIKGGIAAASSLAGGIKTIVNTVDEHKKANEEIFNLKAKNQREIDSYKAILDMQKQVKEQMQKSVTKVIQENTTNVIPQQIKQETVPLTFNSTNKEVTKPTSSLSKEQLDALRNVAKSGDGLRVY